MSANEITHFQSGRLVGDQVPTLKSVAALRTLAGRHSPLQSFKRESGIQP